MIVVSDTSPISNLIRIGEMDLLREIFGKIIVPTEVFREICEIETNREFLENQDWIEVKALTNHAFETSLLEELDSGEAEAIALAVELRADYLLIDEIKGRAIAKNHGIRVTGLIGILLKSKEQGLIPEVAPYLQRLVQDAGFWLKPDLIREILKIADEE